MNPDPPARCRLYLITPPALSAGFAAELEAALDAGDVACVQLRLKGTDDAVIRKAAEALQPICRAREVAFLLNDRPDIAASVQADGVHIGQGDVDYAHARTLVGSAAIVGVTCHASKHLAYQAGEQGADYVAFGAFFPSASKPPAEHADLQLLRDWSETMTVPCVAIGGITVENCSVLVEAGADFLAVIGGVWAHKDGPAAAVSVFNQVFAAHMR